MTSSRQPGRGRRTPSISATQAALLVLSLAIGGALSPPSGAATYLVTPAGTGDFPTIQAAVTAAVDGDEIYLTDGVFTGDGNRDVNLQGKALTIASQSGLPGGCIIDCQGSPSIEHRAFILVSGETEATVIRAITMRHGSAPSGGPSPIGCGGAVLCMAGASPTIIECRFNECDALLGGAVYCEGPSNPHIVECIFENNTASLAGGLFLRASLARVERCTFLGNAAHSDGGAMDCHDGADADILECTFIENAATQGGGIQCKSSSPRIQGCTFYANAGSHCAGIYIHSASLPLIENTVVAFSSEGPGVLCVAGGEATLSCCDVYGNAGGDWVDCIEDQLGQSGNICLDPLFCDPDQWDLHLDAASPCAPNAQPVCGGMGAWPVGCGTTAAGSVSWGALKGLFR